MIRHQSIIPVVKTSADFRAFSQTGRDLAHWHLSYGAVACHPGVVVEGVKIADAVTGDRRYRKTTMKFGETMDGSGKSVKYKSGDANVWATDIMGNPKYPLELFLRVVTVGLETMKVVNGLTKLQID